jgi:hypothetical protein
MNNDEYTGLHTHPASPTVVERRDGEWDVFVAEPAGSCPELEGGRIDPHHIFVRRLQDIRQLEDVAEEIETTLGEGYQRVLFYRESGSRRIIQKIVDHLKARGAHAMWVRSTADNEWELLIRRKDFPIAGEIILSNV